jgi:hypothetical protein
MADCVLKPSGGCLKKGSNNKTRAISVAKKRIPLTQPFTINESNGKQAALHKSKASTP